MTRTPALSKLMEVARRKTDVAAQLLGASCSRSREEENKLALLLDYRRDYQARFDAAIRAGVDRVELRNFHEFLRKLDVAIEQQQKIVAQHQGNVAARRDEWRAANRSLKSFDTLARREQAATTRRERKREQREHDETAARALRTASRR